MTRPVWLDAGGRPGPTRACWTCGREVYHVVSPGDLQDVARRLAGTVSGPSGGWGG
jgi:hypothetical protein